MSLCSVFVEITLYHIQSNRRILAMDTPRIPEGLVSSFALEEKASQSALGAVVFAPVNSTKPSKPPSLWWSELCEWLCRWPDGVQGSRESASAGAAGGVAQAASCVTRAPPSGRLVPSASRLPR